MTFHINNRKYSVFFILFLSDDFYVCSMLLTSHLQTACASSPSQVVLLDTSTSASVFYYISPCVHRHHSLPTHSSLQPDVDLTLQQIFDKVRVAIYKNRVRSIEFFKDYDRLRSGIITEHQFNSALVLAIGKEAQLSPPEVQKVIEYYRTPDGRVQYKEFCDMLEHGNGGVIIIIID